MAHSAFSRAATFILASVFAASAFRFAPNASIRGKKNTSIPKTEVSYTDGKLTIAESGSLSCKITVKKDGAAKAKEIFIDMAEKVLGEKGNSEKDDSSTEIILDYGEFDDKFDERLESLTADGFVIAERDGKVYIYGNNERGLRYGVYAFFENFCGVRYLTADVDYIPEAASIEIPKDTFDLQNPAFEYRRLEYYQVYHNYDFADKLRLNASEEDRRWGLFVHTFFDLIPPEKYFEEHPEWYALIGGERKAAVGGDYSNVTQLCCSNDEMIAELIKNLGEMMKQRPDCDWWSVSQEDNEYFCQCEKCREIAEQTGTLGGPIYYMIEKVAAEYPDKTISTLAYTYSFDIPKNIEFRDNVLIMFCPVEYYSGINFGVDENEYAEKFESVFTEFGKLTKIYLWDYIINFNNLMMPFPNLYILKNHLQYFADNNVTMVFMQGNREVGGDMWALREYVTAKLMWNPDLDTDELIDDFLNCYYGAAAPMMREYINLLTSKFEEAKAKDEAVLQIYAGASTQSWTSKDSLREYIEILDRALEAVQGDADLTHRVEEQKMSVVYTLMFQLNKKDKQEYLEFFKRVCDESGVTQLGEFGAMPVEVFYEKSKMK